MVEVFTKPGVNPEVAKKYIFEKTGMVPTIYEHGTHFVANHELTLEILKEISDSDDVLEVAGDYTGNVTSRGPSHVHSDHCPLRNLDYAYWQDHSNKNRKRFADFKPHQRIVDSIIPIH